MFADIPDDGPYYIRIDPQDTWSADQTMAMVIAPIIRQMRQRKMGVPPAFLPDDFISHQLVFDFINDPVSKHAEETRAEERWEATLEEMAKAFESISFGLIGNIDSAEREALYRALQNFTQHYFSFWE